MDSAAKLNWAKKPTLMKKAGLHVKVRPMGVRGHVAEEEIESGIWVLMMDQGGLSNTGPGISIC